MPAYIVVDCTVTDAARYDEYKVLAQRAVDHYGGRYLVRGGATTVLEGEWQPNRIVVLEFRDIAAVRRFYASPEYREARSKREGAARMNMVGVEGI